MQLQHLFPPPEVALKIVIAIGIGFLVGLEREWAQKDVGVRTFAVTSLLGMLGSLLGAQFALLAVIGCLLFIVFINLRAILANRAPEITTSVSLIVVCFLGILAGRGHMFTPVASAIILTMLLTWKAEFTRFAGGLTPQEIRSGVLLGLLGLVIYPLLPNHFIDKWHLLNPREAWITVIVLAGIGFVNYVLLRLYSNRGLYYGAVLGGLVNSTAAVAELAHWARSLEQQFISMPLGLILLTRTAMFARNLAILVIFAPAVAAIGLWPLLSMALAAALIAWSGHRRGQAPEQQMKISSPVSLRRVFSMGAIFVTIQIASALAERHTGRAGFLIVSFIGGLVSSASTTASAALMSSRGEIDAPVAAAAVVLASVSSALSNLPIIYQQSRNKALSRAVAVVSFGVVLIGLGVLGITRKILQ
jgi:uncharacterized membrane protein (DUF4010 family)